MIALSIFNRMSMHQKAWEKVLDASNRDDGVLEVRDAKTRFITSIASKINRWSS